MNAYSQIFSLKDIFANDLLRGKIPLIKPKEIIRQGKAYTRTEKESVYKLAYNISVNAATPFYKPLKAVYGRETSLIGGNLVSDINTVQDAVYNALMASKNLFSITANSVAMISDALRESENTKCKYGLESRLYLKATSIQQIAGMSKNQIYGLFNDVMKNIMYSDNFPLTQAKYKVSQLYVDRRYSYNERRDMWKKQVGE